jgi:hypothetical protein
LGKNSNIVYFTKQILDMLLLLAGKHCGHSVLLSDPDVLPSLARLGYEGDFVQTKTAPLKEGYNVNDKGLSRLTAGTAGDIFKVRPVHLLSISISTRVLLPHGHFIPTFILGQVHRIVCRRGNKW